MPSKPKGEEVLGGKKKRKRFPGGASFYTPEVVPIPGRNTGQYLPVTGRCAGNGHVGDGHALAMGTCHPSCIHTNP